MGVLKGKGEKTMILKNSAKLYLRLVGINLMCFFLALSFSFFAASVFAEKTGYVAYGVLEEGGKQEKLYTYLNTDGEDTQKAEYEAKGYRITTVDTRKVTETGNVINLLLIQTFSFAVVMAFLYPSLRKLGVSDANMVKFEGQREDKLKGLKIGLLANVPAFVFLCYFAVTKSGLTKTVPSALFKYTHCYLYSLIEWITRDAKFGALGTGKFLLLFLLLAILPLISTASYYLGYSGIEIGDKLMFSGKSKK